MMKLLKIAMMSLTHGHTRKYYQTLRDNPKLDWVAVCAEEKAARDVYALYQTGVPCYDSAEAMFAAHPDIEAVVLASANDKHMMAKWLVLNFPECSARATITSRIAV